MAITCEAQGSVLKSAAPSTVTHCNQLAYATTYSFADDATVWLNEFVLREHADNEQEYVKRFAHRHVERQWGISRGAPGRASVTRLPVRAGT